MPCGDISEQIQIKLDNVYRLTSYSLSKGTCGGPVGVESLISNMVEGKTAEEIIEISNNEIYKSVTFADKNEEYLVLKHLFALQITLEAYLGDSSGAAGESCAIASVEYGEDETIIDADINLKLVVEKIESCAGCNCGI